MKNVHWEKVSVYRNTKKDWNKLVSFHQITWNKFKCNDCGAEVSKTRVDSHESSHRPAPKRVETQTIKTQSKVSNIMNARDRWDRFNWWWD